MLPPQPNINNYIEETPKLKLKQVVNLTKESNDLPLTGIVRGVDLGPLRDELGDALVVPLYRRHMERRLPPLIALVHSSAKAGSAGRARAAGPVQFCLI